MPWHIQYSFRYVYNRICMFSRCDVCYVHNEFCVIFAFSIMYIMIFMLVEVIFLMSITSFCLWLHFPFIYITEITVDSTTFCYIHNDFLQRHSKELKESIRRPLRQPKETAAIHFINISTEDLVCAEDKSKSEDVISF